MKDMQVIAFVIKNNGGKTLFVKRSPAKKSYPNLWSFPCEMIEDGETILETAIRGGKEYLGVKIELQDKFDELNFFDEDEKIQKRILFFNTKIAEGNINVDPDDISEMIWEDIERFLMESKTENLAHGLQYLRSKLVRERV